MKKMERRITIDFHWTRADGGNIQDEHIEALDESAWGRIVEMGELGYTEGELNDHIRMSDDDPENGVHYRGWWKMIGAEDQQQTPRVLITVSGGIADYVSDKGVDVEIFDHDNYKDDPVGTDPVPAHFRDLAEPIDVPVEGGEA